jgi:hypothetical protein
MEITYTMIGSDGQQYGPVTLEQFKTWVSEGRILPDTKVMRSDTKSWLAATRYVELGLAPVTPPALPTSPLPLGATPMPAGGQIDPRLVARAGRSARWFYWIAGLSLVNVFAASSHVVFVVGLALGEILPTAAAVVLAGVFALFGVLAHKGHIWAYIVGMILYAVDAALCALATEWLAVAFHAYVLWWLFMGVKANLELKAAMRSASM